MKINDALQQAVTLNNEKTENKPAPRASETKAVGTVKTNSCLRLAAQLQSIAAAGANEQVYDADKVNAIKSAISSGQFRVDSEKVADGLINTVKDLLSAPR